MKTSYTKKEIEDLVDAKLSFDDLHRMMSSFKDPDRFEKYIGVLQKKVPWNEPILLPLGPHLYIVQKPDGARVVRCDCGYEFGDCRANWKLSALIHVRNTDESLREVYPPMMHSVPEWMEIREFYCPGCAAQLEVEAVPPGYPFVFDFLPDIDTFYRDWLGKEPPG
ncbi:MAG: acetone carboxylase subunit gamma [bacterium]